MVDQRLAYDVTHQVLDKLDEAGATINEPVIRLARALGESIVEAWADLTWDDDEDGE